MAETKKELTEAPLEGTTWEVDLQRVGFVRRLFMARRWYGADWWFVAISSVAVFILIIIALFPGLFSPYSPDALVGSRFLAPGEHVNPPVLVVLKDLPIIHLRT